MLQLEKKSKKAFPAVSGLEKNLKPKIFKTVFLHEIEHCEVYKHAKSKSARSTLAKYMHHEIVDIKFTLYDTVPEFVLGNFENYNRNVDY